MNSTFLSCGAGLAAIILAFAVIGGSASAQQATSATYDDWVLQCEISAAPAPKKQCAISQLSRMSENNAPFSRLVIQRPANGKPAIAQAQLPVNISTRAPIALRYADADPGVSNLLDRCTPGGCFVDIELKDDVVKKFLAAAGPGKMTFKDSSGHDVIVPVSLKGFRTAYDAMLKE